MTFEEFDAIEATREAERQGRLAATTPHIRQRMAPRGGNQFYLDRSERVAATMCGAEVTERDYAFSPTRKRWPAEVCGACIAARMEAAA